MSSIFSNHVSSEHLGEAAARASLQGLRDVERRHVRSCAECQRLYAGYRLADRLLTGRWSEVKLPAEAVAQPRRLRFLPVLRAGLAGGFGSRSLAPAAITLAAVALIGVGVVLPQLMPAATPVGGSQVVGPSGSATSPGATSSQVAATSPSPSVKSGGSGGGGGGTTAKPSPTAKLSPIVLTPVSTASVQGEPIAWAPDGRHVLMATSSGSEHQIQVRDAAGGLTGTCEGDDAAWVDSATAAIAVRSSGSQVTVSLVGVNCHRKATLPGTYTESAAAADFNGGMLLGSGRGQLAIAGQGGHGASDQTFVVWDGHSLTTPQHGVPIAWSADGRRLAVLDTGGHTARWGSGGSRSAWGDNYAGSSISGSLDVFSFPGLRSVASISGSFHVDAGSPVYGYALAASFSPGGRNLLISGTLVDLNSGATRQVGQGDWLADGTLVTTSGGRVLRWRGTGSTSETRLPGGGVIETSSAGDVIEYFTDGRAPYLLAATGVLYQISLPGVASISSLLVSPDGGAIACNGRAPGGSSVAAIASLR
jgi:hypothetical protein